MLKKVVVIGPESTGKSTLSAGLAYHFKCPWVPETAREYLAGLGRPYRYEDLLKIAKAQIKSEELSASKATKLLICDTDLQVIHVWSQHKFGKTDPWILKQIQFRTYDYYLLTNIDMPWEDDPQREYPDPEVRAFFFKWYKSIVQSSGIPYSIVSGNEEERLKRSVEVVENIF